MTLTKSDIEKIIKTDLKDWKYTDSRVVDYESHDKIDFGEPAI